MEAEEIQRLVEQGIDVASISQSSGNNGEMSLRQRWLRTMHYQKVDKLPNMEFGYWEETLKTWQAQGLPDTITDEKSAYEFFGIENWQTFWVNVFLSPSFKQETISIDDEYRIYRDENRALCKINVKGDKSIPHYIEYGIKSRDDWAAFLERLDPDASERIPDNLEEIAEAFNNSDIPVGINIGSMIGIPRNLLGFEGIALMTYDDPEFLEEIIEHLCQVSCSVLEKVLPYVNVDVGMGWEDICFNSGPIVSPAFMREVVLPRYKRITSLLRKHGCHLCWTDCDGNINPIADIFLEGGINCMFPVEVNGGTDPIALRERFGWEMRFQGGVCKMKMRESPQAIEKELHRLLPLVKDGGFVPGVDHRVPKDIPLSTYMYYLKLKRELFNVGGTPQYDESKVGMVNSKVVIPNL